MFETDVEHPKELSGIVTKYFFTSYYNKFAGETVNVKIKKWLVDKSDISGVINNSDLEKKIATLATKAELKA